MRSTGSRRLGLTLAAAGGLLGIVAGVLQATVGSRIPSLSGAKADPVALGLLTIGLSVLVLVGAFVAARADLAPGARLGAMAAVLAPALVCFTTVGALWVVPGLLILLGAGLLGRDGRAVLDVVRTEWARVLIVALGGCELLLAAGSSPVRMAVGALGGVALIAAAGVAHRSPVLAIVLLALGAIPFAVIAWVALVPVLLLVLVMGLAVPAVRTRPVLTP